MSDAISLICAGCGQYENHSSDVCHGNLLLMPNDTCHYSTTIHEQPESNSAWNFDIANFGRQDTQQWLSTSLTPTTPISNGHAMSRQTSGNIISNSPVTPLDQVSPIGESGSTDILSADKSKLQVPTIITHFPNQSNTLGEVCSHEYGYNTMTELSADWMQLGSISGQLDHFQTFTPVLSAGLQHPFQPFDSSLPVSVNTSPTFSFTNTPSTLSNREFSMITPRPHNVTWTPSSMGSNSFTQYSPRSPYVSSPYTRRNQQPSSRLNQSNHFAVPKHQPSNRMYSTEPTRQKRPMPSHSHSESSIPDARRRRAISNVFPLSEQTIVSSPTHLQPPTPLTAIPAVDTPYPPDMMPNNFSFIQPMLQPSPVIANSPFGVLDHLQYSVFPTQPNNKVGTQNGNPHGEDPPLSDLYDCPESRRPIRQQPQCEGDIYTPLWKRRDAKGQYWEGWCGMCSPGVWLSMKTSRYWDDKKRNHGISAKTKKHYPEPVKFRTVDLNGQEVDPCAPPAAVRDFTGQIVGDANITKQVDRAIRKQEGQCGNCGKWVLMSGARARIDGKQVGWWLHAADCYKDEKEIWPSPQIPT